MKRRLFLSPLLKVLKKVLSLFFSFLFIHFAFASHDHGPSSEQCLVNTKGVAKLVYINDEFLDILIQVESANNPRAYRRSSGARGLAQITPTAWKDLVVHYPIKYRRLNYKRDIFRPDIAREAGKDYLRILKIYLKTKHIPPTLDNLMAAYNWGVTNLSKYGLKSAPKETKRFIVKVKRLLLA